MVMAKTAIRFLIHRAGPVVLLAVVLAGCGDGHPGSAKAAATSPTTTRTSTPAPTPSTTATASSAGIPDDFPLARGLIADGETTVTAAQRGVKGVDLRSRCWGGAWPGAAVDRLVVEQVGPERGVTRELALYPDVATAAAVAKRVHAYAEHCHRLPATPRGAAIDVTRHGDVDTGVAGVSVSFTETQAAGQPGGAVFVFTQVGRAILAVEDSGEWTRDSAVAGVRDLERADRGLVARLCVFSNAGC